MVDIKDITLISRIPSLITKSSTEEPDNKRISEWLEKLHIQGEKIRIDDNRREENAKKAVGASTRTNKSDEVAESDLRQHGIDSHNKTTAAKNEADRQMVNDLVRKSNRRIISISSSFPWSVFPETIEVQESRVTFKFNQLFSSQSHNVEIKDISNVFIESSFLHATLQVVSRTYIKNDIKIRHLNKRKAVLVQRIIEGLRTFTEHNINTSNYGIDELIAKIGEFHTN